MRLPPERLAARGRERVPRQRRDEAQRNLSGGSLFRRDPAWRNANAPRQAVPKSPAAGHFIFLRRQSPGLLHALEFEAYLHAVILVEKRGQSPELGIAGRRSDFRDELEQLVRIEQKLHGTRADGDIGLESDALQFLVPAVVELECLLLLGECVLARETGPVE